jgi:hypothetical protein
MAMAVWIPTAATGSGNRTRPHITQLSDLQLNGGATRFQVSQRVGHKSGRNLLLQQIPVRLRRLMREGFAEFLISMALASLSAILLDVYMRDKLALDQAIRDETVKVMGGREEPNDSA